MTNTHDSQPDRVLLVDDNLTNLQVLYQALEEEGYELFVAQSGEEALTTAAQTQPQLILLDINMPGLDGYETCKHLRANDVTKESVVIFLSARGAVDDKVHGLELGAVDYIEKPFQFEEVVARVRNHLESYHERQTLKAENEKLREQVEDGFREYQEADVKRLAAGGESERVEFKSTLRLNLHTEKFDKRIENACLKTIAAYLNSEGGVLLVGVDDEGKPLGIEADQFPNEDKFLLHWNGLITKHLGAEFLPFVRNTIMDFDEKRVLVAQALASSKPVFLSRDNDETFYVRAGNRTNPLKPSELLAYLQQRQAKDE